MRPTSLFALAVLTLLLAGPLASASPNDKTPQNLQVTFNQDTDLATLTWNAVTSGSSQFQYLVWRDGTSIGSTTGTTFTDAPPSGPRDDAGVIYFVSSAPPGNTTNVSFPAVQGVPVSLGCEVISTSTSWNPPFLHATLHMECLGLPVTKESTWTAPSS